MTLQLADAHPRLKLPSSPRRAVSVTQASNKAYHIHTKPFIYVPNHKYLGIPAFIREDKFDRLNPTEYKDLMNALAKHQREVKSGLMSEEDYMLSKSIGKQKRELKLERKKAKTDVIKSKADAKRTRAGAAQERATHKGIAGSIFGGKNQGGAPTATPTPFLQTPTGMAVIGGGALLLIGGIYLATKKKK
jgi:hypothetical protein